MDFVCKHYRSDRIVKNGLTSNKKQRYKCRVCEKTFREGDERQIYDFGKKIKVLQLYLEGVGIRSISRVEGVSAPLIIDWIRDASGIIQKKLSETQLPKDIKEIQILELDELFTYCPKKTNKIYVWLAVDRVRNKVVDVQVSQSREFSAYFPMALRLQEKYMIDIFVSDYCDVYSKYKIAKIHIMTKKETALVESKNSLIRHYPARFHRKTKRHSKSINMIYNSILLLFNKSLIISLFT